MRGNVTRDHIVSAADRLFYEHGYAHTSFTDIAGAVGISRGNFYHHFKTKDDILEAVIAHRLTQTRAMLQAWDAAGGDAAERIRSFSHMLIANREPIMRHGCPVGALCGELAKLGHSALPEATGLFSLFREWLAGKFTLLGFTQTADDMALHLLARSQGIAALANTFHDEAFIRREVGLMDSWLDAQLRH